MGLTKNSTGSNVFSDNFSLDNIDYTIAIAR